MVDTYANLAYRKLSPIVVDLVLKIFVFFEKFYGVVAGA